MGRFNEDEDDDDFVGGSFEADAEEFADNSGDRLLSGAANDRHRMRQFTERRRRIEELRELSRLRDQLGIYDDDLNY